MFLLKENFSTQYSVVHQKAKGLLKSKKIDNAKVWLFCNRFKNRVTPICRKNVNLKKNSIENLYNT